MAKEATELWIKAAGLFSVVQDAGRMGYQASGLPVGGALDRQAAETANWLVGQGADAPVLEITLQGPVIQFEGSLQIALAGGDLSPCVNGQSVPMYETLNLSKGDLLTFGARKKGARSYLAIGGDWQIPSWLGSSSALRIGKKNWPPGSILEKGDRLRILPADPIVPRSWPSNKRPFHSSQLTVRLLPGPEFSWFSSKTVEFFTTHSFTLSPDCNRMGYRLQEALPAYRPEFELISSGIVPGTIQVLPSGKPVILLADAQTSGGYPRIANVLDSDLDHFGQLVPGDKVRFILTALR